MKKCIILMLMMAATSLVGSVIPPQASPFMSDVIRSPDAATVRAKLEAAKGANGIAEAYCRKARIVSPNARQGIHDFVNGVAALGKLTNLLDFAFFCAGQNVPNGNPVSLNSEGHLVGSVVRLNGGWHFPNWALGQTSHMYFTNLPPTPNGRTILVWWAGPPQAGPVANDTFVYPLQIYSPEWTSGSIQSIYGNGGQYNCQLYTPGNNQNVGFKYFNQSDTGLVFTWVDTDVTGAHFGSSRDSVYNDFGDQYFADDTHYQPSVLMLGLNKVTPTTWGTTGYRGIYRAYAMFNYAIPTNELAAINALVPRVGVITEGDSKSVSPQDWGRWFIASTNTWGLYALRTNSAVSGSLVSSNNCLAFWGSDWSMESRFATDAANYPTNKQYPVTLYVLRGGHNDLNATNAPNIVSNAVTAITNLWKRAKLAGYLPVGVTVDRTTVTWERTGVFPSGASNALAQLNGVLRASSSQCASLVDNERYYVNYLASPVPYTNTTIYNADQTHDNVIGPFATNNLQQATFTLGYEYPSQVRSQDDPPMVRISAEDITLTSADSLVLLSGNHSATLPSAALCRGPLTIKCTSAGTNAILTVSSQTIDGASKWTNTAVNKFTTLLSDGAGWQVVGSN